MDAYMASANRAHRSRILPTASQNAATKQREQYFKYSTILKAFLSGIITEVLRTRLHQASAKAGFSVKQFLLRHRINIALALEKMKTSTFVVYPPSDQSPNLQKWNTPLVCLVLRATNCLTVREEDDVVFLANTYRRYFQNSSQMAFGTIAKQGTRAKRDWIKVCSAVQRCVEDVGDHSLIIQVRNFICKIEMESRTESTRKETQVRLETLISEMVADNPDSRYTQEKTEEMVKRQQSNMSNDYHKNSKHKQRARSADPSLQSTLPTIQNDNHIVNDHKTQNRQRCQSVNRMPLSFKEAMHLRRYSLKTQHNGKLKMDNEQSETKYLAEDGKCIIGNDSTQNGNVKGLQTSCGQNGQPSNTPTTLTGDKVKINTPSFEEIELRNKSLIDDPQRTMMLRSKGSEQSSTKRGQKKRKGSKKYVYKSEKHNSDHGRQKKTSSGRNTNVDFDDVIHIPTANYETTTRDVGQAIIGQFTNHKPEPTKTTTHDGGHTCDGHLTNHKPERNSSVAALDREANNKHEEHSIRNNETTAITGTSTDNINNEREEHMKKIADDVLVHQQIDAAVKNPYLQDKHFVDEFFSFLHKNRVTKKFLRLQTTDPKKSWTLQNGETVQFSFFLAFVFRHVGNRETDHVLYVLQKMLNRMQCSHRNTSRPLSSASSAKSLHAQVVTCKSDQREAKSVGQISTNTHEILGQSFAQYRTRSRSNNTCPFTNMERKDVHGKSRSRTVSLESFRDVPKIRTQRPKTNCSKSPKREQDQGTTLIRNRSHSPKLRSRGRHHVMSPRYDRHSNRSESAKLPKIKRHSPISNNIASTPRCRSKSPKHQSTDSVTNHGRKSPEVRKSRSRTKRHSRSPRPSSRESIKTDIANDVATNDIHFDERQSYSTSITESVSSIADGHCWKCFQKETAMTICVNWGNVGVCELLLTNGVPYREEHLVAAVNANDIATLKRIVLYLHYNCCWDAHRKEMKEALYIARKHRMGRIVSFLEEEGVCDNRTINGETCTGCFIN